VVRTIVAGLALFWVPGTAVALGVLWIFADLRRLSLDQVRNSWEGLSQTLRDLGLGALAQTGDEFVRWALAHWWLIVPSALFALIAAGSGFGWLLGHRILRAFALTHEPLDRYSDSRDPRPPAPLPVQAAGVSLRYPGAVVWALRDVDVAVGPGELVAVVGANGSGKSTMARILVGVRPTEGRVLRPGSAGLGQRGGSAIVFQRPEAQVLGVRVRDDLRWGLRPGEHLDLERLLDRVGLAGFEDRETATLSGGELQRLAVASASARGPKLLISDEATSMLDAQGRRELLLLLRELAGQDLGVVHITHDPREAAQADRTITLEAGRIVDRMPEPAGTRNPLHSPRFTDRIGGRVSIRGVGHT
jgi:energy-coupling factor transport system ATP-binding protein